MSSPTVSVVLPVHLGVRPDHLSECLRSLCQQTCRADQVIIVEDGPLSSQHHSVLEEFVAAHQGVTRVKLPINQGAGVANQAGLIAARGVWIAKVDADDICRPDRFERQLQVVNEMGVDVCGAAMLEFTNDSDHLRGLREMPASHAAIVRRLRWNNPINHPTAFYRRDLAVDAGGYPPWRYMQDYGLFARMLNGGARMTNIAEVLVDFRAGPALTARRRKPEFTRLEWELQRLLRETGAVGRGRMYINFAFRVGYRRLPQKLMTEFQGRVLARRATVEGEHP